MNRRIYIAIVLLGVSMLGVIGFQAYWLHQSYKTELLGFQHDVHRSLSMAMNQELDRRISNVVDYMGGDTFVYNNRQGHTRRHRNFRKGNGTYNHYEYEQIITADSSGDSALIEVKKYNWKSNGGERMNFDFQRKKMDRIFLSILNNMDSPSRFPGVEFDSDEFNKAFKRELNQFDINLDYKLAIVGRRNEIINNINGAFSEDELKEAVYFPMRHSSISGSNVAILFPEKDMYIISKNAIMSLTSIILIFLSIGSIVYIIKRFFNQKRISEIRRDFMNNMTHELKTPISTVGLALEAMQNFKILENPERTKQYIGIARKENHRLGMLVEKVLKMSAYERENIQMKWEVINGDLAVVDVIENLNFQLENNGGSIIKDMNADTAMLKVDKVHFTNVIYNLIDNAMKYSEGKPEIKVKTYTDKEHWFAEISDKGVGIPVSYQNKIFEKFFRVPSGNVHNVKGYGLGLSYVFNIINKFEGDISVKSDVDKGSTFTIKIPVNNG
ncbi:MAG: HAMP domain-containing sensor histidine kinase [Bacteroidota bacterium]